MKKLSLLPPDHNDPVLICEAIRSRRGGMLNKLDRMLLHSPVLAEGWNFFFQKLREETILPPKLRELTICVVAVINKASYEFEAHAPLLIDAGANDEQLDNIHKVGSAEFEPNCFSPIERDVIKLTVQITKDIKVSSVLKERLLMELDERQLVELIAISSAYNLVSRFLVATNVISEEI